MASEESDDDVEEETQVDQVSDYAPLEIVFFNEGELQWGQDRCQDHADHDVKVPANLQLIIRIDPALC